MPSLFIHEIVSNTLCQVAPIYVRVDSQISLQKLLNRVLTNGRVLEQPMLGGVGIKLGVGPIARLLEIYDSQNQLLSSPVHLVRSHLA